MTELIKVQNLILSKEQIAWLLPYLIIAFGGMVSLIVGVAKSFPRNLTTYITALLTLGAALYSIHYTWGEPGITLFNKMLAADNYSNFFNVILILSTGLVVLASYPYLEKENIHYPEYYSLFLFSCLGMMLLVSALDLVVLFIALEIMSLGVYVLVGFRRADVKSNEAAVKYFVLGSLASAILLYGIALLYGATGTMNVTEILNFVKTTPEHNTLFSLGAILVLSGFLFKVAAAPFHMWIPDVYEGAPTTVTNFMTTGLKAAAFAAFVRVFLSLGYTQHIDIVSNLQDANSPEFWFAARFHDVLWVIAALTMFLGNVIALTQNNIKRMLAYSSIAHSGYILVGFLSSSSSEYGLSAILLYVVAYVVMNLGAFAIVALISEQGDKRIDIEDFAGLGFKHPILGFAMAVFMLSMAGIPPTAGFVGKYLVFSSAIQAGEIWLVVLGVLCSAISAYYYLRVLVFMYMREPARVVQPSFPLPTLLTIGAMTIATLQFGFFPSFLIEAAKKAVMGFSWTTI